MLTRLTIALAAALLSAPAFAQSQTTTSTNPSSSTTTTTQPAQPAQPGSANQVVVSPQSSQPANTTTSSTTAEVVAVPESIPSPMATVALDTVYGGIGGLLVGGGFALINQGQTWQRDIMIGSGIGLLVGAGAGAVHAVINETERQRLRERAAR